MMSIIVPIKSCKQDLAGLWIKPPIGIEQLPRPGYNRREQMTLISGSLHCGLGIHNMCFTSHCMHLQYLQKLCVLQMKILIFSGVLS